MLSDKERKELSKIVGRYKKRLKKNPKSFEQILSKQDLFDREQTRELKKITTKALLFLIVVLGLFLPIFIIMDSLKLIEIDSVILNNYIKIIGGGIAGTIIIELIKAVFKK